MDQEHDPFSIGEIIQGVDRKYYHGPELSVYGDLWELTRSSTEDVNDFNYGGSGTTT